MRCTQNLLLLSAVSLVHAQVAIQDTVPCKIELEISPTKSATDHEDFGPWEPTPTYTEIDPGFEDVSKPIRTPDWRRSNVLERVNDAVNPSKCVQRSLPGFGPVPLNDTVEAFHDLIGRMKRHKDGDYAHDWFTPGNYWRAFHNEERAVHQALYLGYHELDFYDVRHCTALCDDNDKCHGVNIFYERTPSATLTADCPDPKSITVIKCTLWGAFVHEKQLTNGGITLFDFTSAVDGSNGYNKNEAIKKGENVKSHGPRSFEATSGTILAMIMCWLGYQVVSWN